MATHIFIPGHFAIRTRGGERIQIAVTINIGRVNAMRNSCVVDNDPFGKSRRLPPQILIPGYSIVALDRRKDVLVAILVGVSGIDRMDGAGIFGDDMHGKSGRFCSQVLIPADGIHQFKRRHQVGVAVPIQISSVDVQHPRSAGVDPVHRPGQ